MKFKLFLMQVILASLFSFVGIVLLVIHIFKPSIDFTKEALFFFGLNVPVFMPEHWFDTKKVGNAKAWWTTLFAGFFSLLLILLGKQTITSVLFNMTNQWYWDILIRLIVGFLVFGIIQIVANELTVKKLAEREIEKKQSQISG